jgi:antitoxin component YwqK of YwqJK toxin-antitoxin module
MLRYTYFVLLLSMLSMTGCDSRSFYRDIDGKPHGTGVETFRYSNGAKRVEAWFKNGRPDVTRWYKPDGQLIAETRWIDGRGIGYVLRDDGSIRIKGEVVNEVLHGRAWIYDEKGTLVKETTYRRGHEVEGKEPQVSPTTASPSSLPNTRSTRGR